MLKFAVCVCGSALTLWALLAGAVYRLKVEPLAVFASGAGRGLGALPAPPHRTICAARRPLAPLAPASVH